jgi:hypothetical protein
MPVLRQISSHSNLRFASLSVAKWRKCANLRHIFLTKD